MDEKIMESATAETRCTSIKPSINADELVSNQQATAGVKYSVGCLAYMGDAVFEMYVRKYLLMPGNRKVSALNVQARKYVSAPAQAKMYHHIEPSLTEMEKVVMKRGRNLHSSSKAKNADMSDYRHATGLEALFGYLFLNEEHERLMEVFELCLKTIEINGKTIGKTIGTIG